MNEGFPIDVVYTWVEDTPEHRRKRAEFGRTPPDNGTNRYASQDELKFSIRSIYKFAPWIHAIFVVCDDDQRPDWLHPDSHLCSIPVHIVPHSHIIPEAHLPTFNSQAIEAHLHRIPNLHEHFIYFNDDMFLGSTVTPLDFFAPNGRPRYYLHGQTQMVHRPLISMHAHAWVNNNQLLNYIFEPRRSRPYPAHQAVAMLRSSFEQAWAHPDVQPHLETTSASRFRNTNNVYLVGFLIYWNIHHRQAAKGTNKGHYLNYTDTLNFHYALLRIEHSHPKLFCINDNLVLRRRQGRIYLQRFFQRYFNWTTIAEI